MLGSNIEDTSAMAEEQMQILRTCLNRDKIKLWLPPFTNNDAKGEISAEMVTRYSTELNISASYLIELLENLRLRSIANIKSNEDYEKSGIATFRVRVIINSQTKIIEHKSTLLITGAQLKRELAALIPVTDSSYIKVICSGKIIQDSGLLENQNIKRNSQLMVLILKEEERRKILQTEKQFSQLEEVKRMANTLSSDSHSLMQVADQQGSTLDMPIADRQALSIALTLHEKGRASSKAKKYNEALLFFIEADEAFKNCDTSILARVDNYAVLCLDIAWCYLCLQSLTQLPDAAIRLKKCEEGFAKSYGPNLERLAALKGDTSSELALFVRLHLLQAIVAYHNRETNKACALLLKAEEEIAHLKVDDDQLTQVMNMGFGLAESRLALRRAKGNVKIAINYIMSQKENEQSVRIKEEEKEKQRKLKKKLGNTIKGEPVNISLYQSLRSMGFSQRRTIKALRNSNNDINEAIIKLSEIVDMNSEKLMEILTEHGISEISMNLAEELLIKYEGDVEDIINHLTTKPTSRANSSSAGSSSTSSSTASASSSNDDVYAMADSLKNDISDNVEDHLDISLEEEETILAYYKTLIG